MPDQSDSSTPGPLTLVIRAAFVPDGEQPPAEFSADFSPLKFRATLDPATGVLTCDNAGMNFDGDVRAEWHPDEDQGSGERQEEDSQGENARGTGASDRFDSHLAGSGGAAARAVSIGSFARASGKGASDADETGEQVTDASGESGMAGNRPRPLHQGTVGS